MKRIVALCLLLVIAASLASAGDTKRRGTAGAQEVLIPVGARSIATAGAFFPSMTGVEAIHYNPAGLSASPYSEAMFNYMSYIADIGVSYAAVSANFADIGAFGVSFKALAFGDIPVTTVEFPDGNGTTFTPGYYVLGLTYARTITDRVSAGVTFKMVREEIMSTSATGLALDFGVQYRFTSGLSLGAALRNIGTDMKYGGGELQTSLPISGGAPGTAEGSYTPETEAFQIPSNFEIGVSYRYTVDADNLLNFGASFRSNNTIQDEMFFGAEYKALNILSLRAGYETFLQEAGSSINGLNLGAGVDYRTDGNLWFAFDYAWRSVKEFPTDNHVFTVKIGFGE